MILLTFQVGGGVQSLLSAAFFGLSKAGRQAVVMSKFEFRRLTPQKEIPIIHLLLSPYTAGAPIVRPWSPPGPREHSISFGAPQLIIDHPDEALDGLGSRKRPAVDEKG